MRGFLRNSIAVAIAWASLASPSPALSFCFEEAGARHNVAPQLLWSIAKWESRFNPNALNYNTNGTYDYGLMQINTIHADELKKLGVPWDSLADPCTNVMVGAWYLSKNIRQYGYNWKAIGAYHSRTPDKRDHYARQISKVLAELNRQQAKIPQGTSSTAQVHPTQVTPQQEAKSYGLN